MEDPGLIAYLESFVSEDRLRRFAEVLQWRTRYITVAMEDVYHLHNASAVIRSADVFGLQDVHIIEERFGKRLDKKIALGAQKWVDIHRHPTTESCLKDLRDKGYRILATTPRKDALSLDQLTVDHKMAFLFGAEKEGLSDKALKEADELIHIPMVGFTESLNVSVAAAIVLQRATSLLHASRADWRMSDVEKEEKRVEWIKKSVRNLDKIVARYHLDR
ncbi:TrmH family RNA methyltransferase [Muriicola marianensis]|uniref:tRNA (guanosine(18)-2'-O)-methyltransferase n=1 Tax=Muriicola marianensis TaxID=1324801 RepID=A0ABQ1R8C5_9FLAO|nr:RNA methyltransferase [Muriicola marianensis]GGD59115.1 tRNA (guanosine(18)-2'-O)-methyltransferase [Muriicola marianensis]